MQFGRRWYRDSTQEGVDERKEKSVRLKIPSAITYVTFTFNCNSQY